MGIEVINKITCDYEKDGKACGKTYLVPENAKRLPPGSAACIRVIDANGKCLVFCGWPHALAFGVSFLKATPTGKANPSQPPPVAPVASVPSRVVKPTAEVIAKLESMGVIVPDADKAGKAVEEL